jgi:hypothetical protein
MPVLPSNSEDSGPAMFVLLAGVLFSQFLINCNEIMKCLTRDDSHMKASVPPLISLLFTTMAPYGDRFMN